MPLKTARVEEALEQPQAIAEELVHTYGGNVSQYDHIKLISSHGFGPL
jgi:hypothetical protein